MDSLKLLALDDEDLRIISTYAQDAVMKIGDLDYAAASRQFVVPMYRFAWEKEATLSHPQPERRNSILHFDRVLSVRLSGVARDKPEDVLSLLAITFTPVDPPAGHIDLVFAGGGTIRLDVECVEARLGDLGGAWSASSRPVHKD